MSMLSAAVSVSVSAVSVAVVMPVTMLLLVAPLRPTFALLLLRKGFLEILQRHFKSGLSYLRDERSRNNDVERNGRGLFVHRLPAISPHFFVETFFVEQTFEFRNFLS